MLSTGGVSQFDIFFLEEKKKKVWGSQAIAAKDTRKYGSQCSKYICRKEEVQGQVKRIRDSSEGPRRKRSP